MRILIALIFSLLLALPAHAQPKTKAQLSTEIGVNFPDNTTGAITPSILRTTVSDFVTSWQQAPQVNLQTGTTYAFVLADYGQLVNFSNASPVAVSLAQATGSFAAWNAMACNLGAGAVTVTPATSTIGGAATLVLQQGQCRTIVSDGTNYQLAGGAVQAVTCAASNWINAITAARVPTCAQPAFTDISGTLQPNKGGTGTTSIPSSGQIPIGNGGGTAYAPQSITGDASVTSGGVWTNSKVNGVAYPASPSTNTIPVVTSANQITYEAVPNAALANSTITLNAGSGVGLTVPGSMALGSTNTIGSTSDTPRFAGLGIGCASSGANFLTLCGSSSGKVDLKAPAVAGTNTLTWPAGTTDFSATGGTSQVVKQTTLGGAFTVAQLAFSDISSTIAAAQIGTTTITGQTVNNSPSASNDYFFYFSFADNAVRKCTIAACSSAATAGVSSLNGLTGGLSIVQGTGINVSAAGTSVTVALTSGRQTLPTTQVFTTGSGTYTTPANVLWIEVECVGGGGGGGGGAGAGGAGGNTTFSTITCTGGAGGGQGGVANVGIGGIGGTPTGGDINVIGGDGAGAARTNSTTDATPGSNGGSSYLGGAGGGSFNASTAGKANTGGGGGTGGSGTGTASIWGGGGGGAGGYARKIINSPAATYSYSVGAGGTAQGASGGANASSVGGSGIVIVREHYGS